MSEAYLERADRGTLAGRVAALFGEGARGDAGAFNRLALDVFEFQYARNPAYRRLCEARGVRPGGVGDWRGVPFVPTDAFKSVRLACFGEDEAAGYFETSGTTQGRAGRHWFASHDLYDGGAMPWFARHVLAPLGTPGGLDGAECEAAVDPLVGNESSEMRVKRGEEEPGWSMAFPGKREGAGWSMAFPGGGFPGLKWMSLTGSPLEMPHSSLVYMIDAASRVFAESHGGSSIEYFFRGGRLEVEALNRAVEAACEAGRPVLILTTAFALVHWLDALEEAGRGFALPPGSRVMETGGYKGRSRVLEKEALYDWAARRLGIATRSIVNEYGMTEMSSQFYDRTLAEPELDEAAARIKRPAPWVGSVVLDPVTLEVAKEGEVGVLAHVDLANLDTCSFLMTGDAARMVVGDAGGGFELLGRLADASPRGCSLDYESLLP